VTARIISLIALCLLPLTTSAATLTSAPDLTAHPVGYLALVIFALAYLFVMAEEFVHLRKSKPVIIAAGVIYYCRVSSDKQKDDLDRQVQFMCNQSASRNN